MDTLSLTFRNRTYWLMAAVLLLGLILTPLAATPAYGTMAEASPEVIVQAEDMTTAEALVQSAGGTVSHELGIIDAVGAVLTPDQRAALAW